MSPETAVQIAPTGPEPEVYPFWDDVRLLLHFTRNWMHFGWIGFIAVCTLIGAVKGLGGVR